MEFVIAAVALIALIIVHELGHFIAAKLTGMRVDELGLGYPPRMLRVAKIGETEYTLNWLPFGGFVKIHGENGMLEPDETTEDPRAFSARPRLAQALVLVAGIAMNLLFAYVLITGALISGTPRALSDAELSTATHEELAVSAVLPDSPAAKAGLVPGDSIIEAHRSSGEVPDWKDVTPASFTSYIAASKGEVVTLTVKRGAEERTLVATPLQGIVSTDVSRYAIGVEVATIGIAPLPLSRALTEGASLTWGVITLSATGLGQFFANIATFKADLSQVAGPVGITVLVGSASLQGLGSLLSIVAIISISLALINLIPVPALDGGRLLLVLIEGVTRRRVPPHIVHSINTIAFLLLIPLMVIVSAHDIWKLFG